MTAPAGRVWHLTLPFLPPGNNHQYRMTEKRGAKALTEEASDLRKLIASATQRAGFEATLKAQYGVRVRFVMPGWSQDIDGPIKALLDVLFTVPGRKQAWDHRIVRLDVGKIVQPGVSRTEVTIWEVSEAEAELAAALEHGERMVRVTRRKAGG